MIHIKKYWGEKKYSMSKKELSKNVNRDSKYELVKILAVIVIVFSHVANQSEINAYAFSFESIFKAFSVYLGQIGNGIFVISSCYFLSKKTSIEKWLNLYFQTLFYSLVFLAFFALFEPKAINSKVIIKSFLPIAFANNWFISAYLLFVPIVPFLNIVHQNTSLKQFGYLTLGFSMLYVVAPTVIGNRYFASPLFGFVATYLIVVLLRDLNISMNISSSVLKICITLGTVLVLFFIIIVNFLGQYFPLFYGKTFFWQFYYCVPLMVVNLAIFELTRRSKSWNNRIINSIASSSLGIYLVHNNILIVECNKFSSWFACLDCFSIVPRYVLTTLLVFGGSLFVEKARQSFLEPIQSIIVTSLINKVLHPIARRIERHLI